MPQQIQIDPSQIPQLLAQNKAEAEAVQKVLIDKRRVLELLDSMEGHIASGDLSSALVCFVEIQKMEYLMQVQAFEQKLGQLQNNIKQLDSLILPAIEMPRIKVNRQ